jgi:hypothetical protein
MEHTTYRYADSGVRKLGCKDEVVKVLLTLNV